MLSNIHAFDQFSSLYTVWLPLPRIRALERLLKRNEPHLASSSIDRAELHLALAQQHALLGSHFCAMYWAQVHVFNAAHELEPLFLAFRSSLYADCHMPELADEYRRRAQFSSLKSATTSVRLRAAVYLARSYFESRCFADAVAICVETNEVFPHNDDSGVFVSYLLQLNLVEARAKLALGDEDGAWKALSEARFRSAKVSSPVARAELETYALMLDIACSRSQWTALRKRFETVTAFLRATQLHQHRMQLCEWLLARLEKLGADEANVLIARELVRADSDLLRLRSMEEFALANSWRDQVEKSHSRRVEARNALRADLDTLAQSLSQQSVLQSSASASTTKPLIGLEAVGAEAAKRALSDCFNSIVGSRSVLLLKCSDADLESVWHVLGHLRKMPELLVVAQPKLNLIVAVAALSSARLRLLTGKVRYQLTRGMSRPDRVLELIRCCAVTRNQSVSVCAVVAWLSQVRPSLPERASGYLVRQFPRDGIRVVPGVSVVERASVSA